MDSNTMNKRNLIKQVSLIFFILLLQPKNSEILYIEKEKGYYDCLLENLGIICYGVCWRRKYGTEWNV